MREEPTSEKAARYILRLSVEHFGARPNDVLRMNNFIGAFGRDGWRGTDFAPGMNFAAENGWVEVQKGGASFRLTQKGYSESNEMAVDLHEECNEIVTIERADGSRHENVPALVTSDLVLVPDARVPIAADDAILRQLPSNIVQRLIVRDPGYHAAGGGFPAHYKVRYRQEGEKPAGNVGYHFHMHGDNSRVNINSTDNSTNSVTRGVEDLFGLVGQLSTLRQALASKASDAEHYAAIGAVANAEIAAKSGDRSKMMGALKAIGSAGKWVFDMAKDAGVELAAKVITEAVKGSGAS